ncbi:MAG: nucleotidyltransferase family protein [Candidatus Korarchaeota archaeon]|nr:nucleotidyltransferase family protein [Candidatus Korarchaeota archaeon]
MGSVREVVILAGGRSTRFGRDKLTYKIDGKEIIVMVAEAAREITEKVILSVRSDEDGERLSKLTGLDYRVDEPLPCTGPIRGVLSSVKEEYTLLLPADLPWVDGDVLKSFLGICRSSSVHICGLLWSAKGRYLDPMIAHIRSLEPLIHVRRACPLKNVRVTDIHRAASSLLMISAGLLDDPWRLLDVDRPEDLTRREGKWEKELLYIAPRTLGDPYRRAIEELERGSLSRAREMFNLELLVFQDVENIRDHVSRDLRSLGGKDGGSDR